MQDALEFLGTHGQMAEAVRTHDWGNTPIGPIEDWGPSLRTAVGMMLSSAFPECIFWGPDMISIYNDAFKPILGHKPESLGKPFPEVWSEIWDTVGPIAAKAYAGEATFIEDFPLLIHRNNYPEQAWFTFCYSPIRDETGRVAGIIDTVVETTGKVRAEQNLRLVNRELAHRMKNMLAIVSAIAGQTFRSTRSKEEASATFAQRMSALGQTYSVLSDGASSGASVRAVLDGALSPYPSGRIRLDGPPLELTAKQALSLGLAANELATNAVKYGALSIEEGEVVISWRAGTLGSDEEFRLLWEERNGPAVSEPTRRGFGSRLIEQALASDFRGTVQLAYDPRGLRCQLTTTMANLHSEDDDHSSTFQA